MDASGYLGLSSEEPKIRNPSKDCSLLNRGLASDVARLFVPDGGKALHKAVTDTFGRCAIIQRCQIYKKQTEQFEVLAEFRSLFAIY